MELGRICDCYKCGKAIVEGESMVLIMFGGLYKGGIFQPNAGHPRKIHLHEYCLVHPNEEEQMVNIPAIKAPEAE